MATTQPRRAAQPAGQIVEFARSELGLELSPAQVEMLATFEAGEYSQAVWQCGRRGGKSLLADVIALYDATCRDDLRRMLRPGEPRVAAIIAPKLDQAEAHIRNCVGLLKHSKTLRGLALPATSDTLPFKNGSEIRAFPCSARSIRGGAWSSVILDELGHFITTEDGNAAGDRILEAAVPSLAQFAEAGWLVAISTPLWKQGAFWTLVERATSGRFAYHYRHLSTAEMNPRIKADWLSERQREDPDMFAREFLAKFVDGVSAYLTSADVLACRRESNILPPAGYAYAGTLDPAYSHDAFSMAIGHRDGQRTVVDGVWTWTRHGHEATLDEVAALAKRYGVQTLRTDQHAAQPIREALEKRKLAADYQPWTNETKSGAFSRLKIGLNSRTLELPNDPGLIEELCGLEARPTPGGLTRIAAAGSGKDDRATAVAALVDALENSSAPLTLYFENGRWFGTGNPPEGTEETHVLFDEDMPEERHLMPHEQREQALQRFTAGKISEADLNRVLATLEGVF